MTKTLFAFLTVFALMTNHISFGQTSSSFEVKYDTLVKHDGVILKVSIINVGETNVAFKYPDENATNLLSKNVVAQIRYASGRTENVSKKIVVKDEKDWENVIITTLESDVLGLARKGEVKAQAKGGTGYARQSHVDQKATDRLKRLAAQMNAHIILIQSQTTTSARLGATAKSLKQGVAYGYE